MQSNLIPELALLEVTDMFCTWKCVILDETKIPNESSSSYEEFDVYRQQYVENKVFNANIVYTNDINVL